MSSENKSYENWTPYKTQTADIFHVYCASIREGNDGRCLRVSFTFQRAHSRAPRTMVLTLDGNSEHVAHA